MQCNYRNILVTYARNHSKRHPHKDLSASSVSSVTMSTSGNLPSGTSIGANATVGLPWFLQNRVTKVLPVTQVYRQPVRQEELASSWLAKAKAKAGFHRGYVEVRERRKGWWSRHLTWLSFPISNVGTVSYPSRRAGASIKWDTTPSAFRCACWLDQQMLRSLFRGYRWMKSPLVAQSTGISPALERCFMTQFVLPSVYVCVC